MLLLLIAPIAAVLPVAPVVASAHPVAQPGYCCFFKRGEGENIDSGVFTFRLYIFY